MATITVTAQKDRRRGGRRFARNVPVEIDTNKIDASALEAIKADPVLVIDDGAKLQKPASPSKGGRKPSAAEKKAETQRNQREAEEAAKRMADFEKAADGKDVAKIDAAMLKEATGTEPTDVELQALLAKLKDAD